MAPLLLVLVLVLVLVIGIPGPAAANAAPRATPSAVRAAAPAIPGSAYATSERPGPRRTPRALRFAPREIVVIGEAGALDLGGDGAPRSPNGRTMSALTRLGLTHGRRIDAAPRGRSAKRDRAWLVRSERPDFDPVAASRSLQATGAFRAVSPNYTFGLFYTVPNDVYIPYQWYVDDGGFADIKLPQAWDVARGDTSVSIAIIDTGSGNYLQPTAGFVQRNLAAAGIDPKSIDTVLLTHMHPDHSAGLTDMSNGQLLFPNAELVMHENELAHWFDDGAMAKVDERSAQLYFLAGREQVAPYKSRTRLFRESEVFPGVTAVPSLGHTPGHTAYLVASGNDQLMIWGDTVHVPEVQTAFPEAGMAFDTDLAAAAAARKRMFDRVSADGILIAGMHLHFPAFSRLARRGDAYALYPEAWVHAL
jgi:glyoxylase-like metal-dependent hydrolase (beta-lactamase superfamily II)